MIVDYHTHTDMSDGRDGHEKYVSKALELRLGEIGFSDHFMFKQLPWVMGPERIPEYVEKIEILRQGSNIPIKLGLEVDYIRRDVGSTREFLNRWGRQIDYCIGSVHHLNSWDTASPDQTYKWKNAGITQTYTKYYELVQELAKSGLFDIVGHLDVGKRYNYYPRGCPVEALWKSVEAISENDLCVEVNTSGLRHACAEIYPERKILEMCYERDIEITLGSDAHRPSEVGADFGKAIKLAKDVGYTTITVFTKKRKEQVELG